MLFICPAGRKKILLSLKLYSIFNTAIENIGQRLKSCFRPSSDSIMFVLQCPQCLRFFIRLC
jgi:hypothetical protein